MILLNHTQNNQISINQNRVKTGTNMHTYPHFFYFNLSLNVQLRQLFLQAVVPDCCYMLRIDIVAAGQERGCSSTGKEEGEICMY